ncbi:MAG: hypothetical protein CMJ82_08290 [Planctomycetaceae bacterium]|nr:hypothetical protein [Planctomycetaceae bacterium]
MLVSCSNIQADEKPDFSDYCKRLEHEIQGRKHGFMAGNLSYYIGGFHASWNLVEDETIGLTHPFFHDLRSRGTGILESQLRGAEHTGVGNDFSGWEFYKDTRVLYGSVILDGEVVKHPKPTSMMWRPDKMICVYELDGVTIREEKFIASNDAVVSVITASRPVQIRFEGHSFFHRNSVSSSAKIKLVPAENALVIAEGGNVKSRPDPGGPERIGPCVYDGMSTVLTCSRDITGATLLHCDERGVQHYGFTVKCDSRGTSVGWGMGDQELETIAKVRLAVNDRLRLMAQKTAVMNQLLNEQVPWFRCPDEKFVDIYYYLWALYLMYYIDVGEGWEQEPHTQTAVNNFLGMHRYDAAFQIKVGAWTQDKSQFAYGNVLTWKHLTQNDRYRELENGIRMLSDNKGIAWHSGAYGGETSEHVLGAWQIYQHTGDVEFLKACYEGHFRKLFWRRLTSFAMNNFGVARTLERMAELTGHPEDRAHWQELVRNDAEHVRRMFDDRWEANGISNYFAGPRNGMLMTNAFWAMRSPHFPQEYARKMVGAWAVNKEDGFFGEFFPLAMAKQSMRLFNTSVDQSFGYTPDTAYFTLDGMFRQKLKGVASELTLNHIENYNWSETWRIPVAPEAYQRDLTLFGDQYSNFNAGKLLLYIEGLAGLSYSIPDKKVHIGPVLPEVWETMELRLPIGGRWISCFYTHKGVRVTGLEDDWDLEIVR